MNAAPGLKTDIVTIHKIINATIVMVLTSAFHYCLATIPASSRQYVMTAVAFAWTVARSRRPFPAVAVGDFLFPPSCIGEE